MNSRNIGKGLFLASLVLIIIFAIAKTNYDAQAGLLCEKLHQDPNYTAATCPIVQDKTSWLFFVGFGVSLVGIAGGAYLWFSSSKGILPPSQTEHKTFSKVDIKELDAEEKRVYELLRERGGSVFQSEIMTRIGFTKVKVSRILDRLENKGILERKRRGMANLIVLR